MRYVVRTVCTATVVEEWVLDAPEDLDFDKAQWNTGWDDDRITVVSVDNERVEDERDREVLSARPAKEDEWQRPLTPQL